MPDVMEPDDRFARRFRQVYESTPAPEPAARARIETAWRSRARRSRSPAGLGFWLEARTVTVRPIAALAAGVALVVAGGLVATRMAKPRPFEGDARAPASAGATALGAMRPVRFVLVAPAESVTLVGDFNGWDATATPLRREHAGDEWTVTVPLVTGWHAYAFVVDGSHWVPDPRAPLAPADHYGERRSVIVVGEGA